ncbi:MAG TPA: hypothetical protein VNK49_06255 [Anaerolineales bacterium]|nr:hypothetical protein [Anaerolineales bacterium]
MKTRLFPTLGLLAVILAACAPNPASPPPAPSASPLTLAPTSLPSPTSEFALTQAPEPTAMPLATSRGPELHATDPATVSLASGQLQLVEFFRFT